VDLGPVPKVVELIFGRERAVLLIRADEHDVAVGPVVELELLPGERRERPVVSKLRRDLVLLLDE